MPPTLVALVMAPKSNSPSKNYSPAAMEAG